LLHEIHGSSAFFIHIGGYFSAKDIAFKIIRKGYYWPTIFLDYYKFAISCDKCQKIVGKEHIFVIPLQHFLPNFPFSKWGLDFIGLLNHSSSMGHIFILTNTNYFTKWIDIVPLRNTQDEQVISFLESNIFSRFGVPLEIIMDNGPAFISTNLTQFMAKLGVKHFTSSSYYPHGNGKEKSTNKNLIRIINRIIEDKPR
jgi:hypothetical protein